VRDPKRGVSRKLLRKGRGEPSGEIVKGDVRKRLFTLPRGKERDSRNWGEDFLHEQTGRMRRRGVSIWQKWDVRGKREGCGKEVLREGTAGSISFRIWVRKSCGGGGCVI